MLFVCSYLCLVVFSSCAYVCFSMLLCGSVRYHVFVCAFVCLHCVFAWFYVRVCVCVCVCVFCMVFYAFVCFGVVVYVCVCF